MKKILIGILAVGATATIAVGATRAYFSDTETSEDNTFVAGSLDLKVDDDDINVVKFTLDNMRPGNQPKATYRLKNAGTLAGSLSLGFDVTDQENSCVEPETDAGDTTCDDPGEDQGELSSVVNTRLFIDEDCNGWIGTEDTVFYNDYMGNLPVSEDNLVDVAANEEVCITVINDWWDTANDNLAQGDSSELDITFELVQ